VERTKTHVGTGGQHLRARSTTGGMKKSGGGENERAGKNAKKKVVQIQHLTVGVWKKRGRWGKKKEKMRFHVGVQTGVSWTRGEAWTGVGV